MLGSYLLWGKYILWPFYGHAGVGRASQLYSIFRVLRGTLFGINLDQYNTYITGILIIVGFLICYKYKIDILDTSIILLLIFWSFLKSPIHNFYYGFFLLLYIQL